jgi:hypothetical protein
MFLLLRMLGRLLIHGYLGSKDSLAMVTSPCSSERILPCQQVAADPLWIDGHDAALLRSSPAARPKSRAKFIF